MKNVVYFDLETQKSFNDVGGAVNKDRMGISVAVTFSTQSGEYQVYGEDKVGDLVDCLRSADLVVGYNHLYFDYAVLQAYTVLNLLEHTINLDMMVYIEKILGFRLKLDSLVTATVGNSKTADGLDALKWWKEFKKTGNKEFLLKIAEYCLHDVKCTKNLYEYGAIERKVKYLDRAGKGREIPVNWKA